MNLVKNHARSFFNAVERIKGQRHFYQSLNQNVTHYSVKTSQGFSFKIHCEEWISTCIYKAWFIPNTVAKTYKVFCEFSSDVPPKYRENMVSTMTFPSMVSKWCSSEIKRKAAIKAYLDITLQQR